MSGNTLIMAWLQQPFLVQLAWVGGIIIFLYVARTPVHSAIRGLGTLIDNATRYTGQTLRHLAHRLRERNREVLLAAGRDVQERILEREFKRVHGVVKRDLSGYPALNRALSEQITRIEEDYRSSNEVPPSPPDWLDAIEAVARIPAKDSPAVNEILESIHQTLVNTQKETLDTYRVACKKRHNLLQKMMPYWRKLAQTMDDVGKKMSDLEDRIPAIDNQMAKYEQILAKTDQAEQMVSSSFLTQFFISGFILSIAVVAGFINFHLIALPMSEMVGGNNHLGPMRTADVAALIIILLEIAMGIFVMESLRVTRLFSAIYTVDDQMRRRMLIAAFTILFTLACVEAALAYMRDMLAADKEALTLSLTGAAAATAEPQFRWIASAGQMVLGFILPFALTFVAIPLESFVQSSRTMLGVAAVALLNIIVMALRLFGHLAKNTAVFITRIYDVVIFAPLALESALRRDKTRPRTEPSTLDVADAAPPNLELPTLFDNEQNVADKPIPSFQSGYEPETLADSAQFRPNSDSWQRKSDDSRMEVDLFPFGLEPSESPVPEKRQPRTITDLLT